MAVVHGKERIKNGKDPQIMETTNDILSQPPSNNSDVLFLTEVGHHTGLRRAPNEGARSIPNSYHLLDTILEI